jgi:hypothetical protein
MLAYSATISAEKRIRRLALPLFAAGVAGMGVSFLFLASSHQLDVIAGASGFVAGAIFIAASLIAMAVLERLRAPAEQLASSMPATLRAFSSPSFVERWLAHFVRNQLKRVEPDWAAPVSLPAAVVQALVHSLEQFQLGDGGGPASLIAWNAEAFRATSTDVRALHDRWFAEEREHARLLGAAVARFGGRPIQSHWSFSAFCQTRKWLGIRFELTVLLLTEIVSTAYYKLLRRHGGDPALRAMSRLILRDEAGHVAFHRARLAQAGSARYGYAWELAFRTLGLAAATMLWINHAPGLCSLGAGWKEFYREVWRGLSRFSSELRREARAFEQAELRAFSQSCGNSSPNRPAVGTMSETGSGSVAPAARRVLGTTVPAPCSE